MKAILAGCLSIIGIGLVAIVAIVFYVLNVYNTEHTLRNRFTAQEEKVKVIYDNVWKTIAQKFEVTEVYKDSFKEVWGEITKNQSVSGSGLKIFLSRVSPNFNDKIYQDLMTTIEGKRQEFTKSQEMLISIKNEHDNLLTRLPSGWLLSNVKSLELKLITSTKTEEAIKSGKEDDIELRKKK